MSELKIWEITKDSFMKLHFRRDSLTGDVTRLRIMVCGEAARIPSVSNNRLNMFPKKRIFQCLEDITSSSSVTNMKIAASKAKEALRQAQVISTINPDFKLRLEALTRLWKSIPKQDVFPLRCDTDNRWLVTVHCHKELNRIDTHNLTKGVCDWLQSVDIIKNDAYVDCWPMRNEDWKKQTPEANLLTIAMRPLRELGEVISPLISTMTS